METETSRAVSPRKTDDLPLPDRDVAAACRDLAIERQPVVVRLRLQREQASRAESTVQLCIITLAEHVEISPQSAGHEFRLRERQRHCSQVG
jgi:hypothetical protein